MEDGSSKLGRTVVAEAEMHEIPPSAAFGVRNGRPENVATGDAGVEVATLKLMVQGLG